MISTPSKRIVVHFSLHPLHNTQKLSVIITSDVVEPTQSQSQVVGLEYCITAF